MREGLEIKESRRLDKPLVQGYRKSDTEEVEMEIDFTVQVNGYENYLSGKVRVKAEDETKTSLPHLHELTVKKLHEMIK